MPRTIRFHLDESCRRRIAAGLRLHGVDVTTTHDVGLDGAGDPEQLRHVCDEGRLLFTHDPDFAVLRNTVATHPGIIYCHQRHYTLCEMIRRLLLYWEIYDPGDMKDRFDFL